MSRRLLGLPVNSRSATAAAALALFIFYALTMSRSLSLYDSAELALVAEQFGLGHPFGQPLHTMLGGLLARIPGVRPLIALNGLSAFFGALAVIPATSFADALLRPDPDCPEADPRLVAPTIALLGLHPALWEPATRIEVYPLAVFFALWAAARFAHAILEQDASWRPYLGVGLALGLSASANVVCAAGVAIAMSPRFLMGVARKEIPRGALGWAGFGGVIGLLSYVYVFAVAGRRDVFVWGAPTDFDSIKHYFTAADFSYKGVASWTEWSTHLGELVIWSFYNGLLAIWLAGLVGYFLFARKRGLGRFFFNATLILFAAFVARNGVFAPDVLDYAGYLAIPTWVAASGAGLFVAYLAARSPWSAAAAVSTVLILVLFISPGPHERTRHLDSFTEEIAREALLAAPPDAIVLVEHDHWVAPMLHIQERRHVRPDVVVLPVGLASSEWYWNFMYRRHPGLELIELRGPGGREARIRRFLRANPTRPIQVEGVALANRLGLATCPSEWLLDVRSRCRAQVAEPALARVSGAALAEVQNGSPGTAELIAKVTLQRGHDLHSQGLPRAAVAALLAGVPVFEGLDHLDLSQIPAEIEPATLPAPRYEPHVALGHPAENLHYASVIARTTGARQLAHFLLGMSDALGPVEPKFATSPGSPGNL